MFYVSINSFMCVFSMCCRNISAIVLDMGDPTETPFLVGICCFEMRNNLV